MAIDDPAGELLTRPSAPGAWGSGPRLPPPPTGPLAPPPPPVLALDPSDDDESTQPGAHRQDAVPPVADAVPPAADAVPPVADAARPVVDVAPRVPDAGPDPTGPLPEGLRLELVELLGTFGGRLQEVFDQYRGGVKDPAAVVAAGAAVSEAVAGDKTTRIRTILGAPWTGAPERARPVAGTARVLMATPGLSGAARAYLASLRTTLLDLAESEPAQQREQALLTANSAVLEHELRTRSGVFVATYPHYWRHPYLAETNRRLLRLGSTVDGTWPQVLDQARAAGAPEDPVVIRVYAAPDPVAAERAFRRLLDSADHERAGAASGRRQWFVTTLEFLDEIAVALGLVIKTGVAPAI